MVVIHVMVFCIVTLCNDVAGFHGNRRFKLQSPGLWCCSDVFQRTMLSSSSGWRRRQYGPLECWYPITSLHSITFQKTVPWHFWYVPSYDLWGL